MAEVPDWHVAGDWFDVCSCDIPCPCEFAQAPTNNVCEGILAWHIREGNFADVRLDGLNALAVAWFEGNIWAGDADVKMGLYLDESAGEGQREALQVIFGGQGGGWPAIFAQLITEIRGMDWAPIAFELADDLSSWRAEVPGRATATAEALSGPTTPPGERVQLLNSPGSEVGPGQVATWGRATRQFVDAFGFSSELEGRSSKHIPFDWSGPDR
jgi:hypothetical protein